MLHLRLLERLRLRVQADKDSVQGGEDDPQALVHSVMLHIGAILNTRQGSCLLDEKFGMPDFTSSGVSFTQHDIPNIEQEIAHFIDTYEPRLTNISVHFQPDESAPMQMCFSLQGELCLGENRNIPVQMMTQVNPLGKVSIRE
jgi:type VI secretion system protein